MKLSLSYYITLFIIKIKGIKKDFSKDPIDYKKIRKEDVHFPKGRMKRKNKHRSFEILDSMVTEISTEKTSNHLLLFVHGGAFISGPAQHHWDTIETIVKHTNHTIWMCDYPKAPEHTIDVISKNIDLIFFKALETYKADQITFIGDSVGGTLITAMTQRLIQDQKALPSQIILVSPVMDATMSNPEITKIDPIDPMLSKTGVISAKKLCAGDIDLKSPLISPLYGSFEGFPKTSLFLAEHDITYPDQLLLVDKLKNANVDIQLIEGEKMPHIWPFLPVMKEAKVSLMKIVDIIKT